MTSNLQFRLLLHVKPQRNFLNRSTPCLVMEKPMHKDESSGKFAEFVQVKWMKPNRSTFNQRALLTKQKWNSKTINILPVHFLSLHITPRMTSKIFLIISIFFLPSFNMLPKQPMSYILLTSNLIRLIHLIQSFHFAKRTWNEKERISLSCQVIKFKRSIVSEFWRVLYVYVHIA